MLTNGEENSLCDHRDELVSYLYAEMAEDQRTRLEAHLLDCTACTDEFAGLSEARFSVFEWQKEEFAPLATPEFTIPYEKTSVAAPAFGERSAAALRSLISFSWPAFAMASLVLVAAGSIALWIFGTGSGTSQELAKNTKIEKSTPIAAPVQVAPNIKEVPNDEVAVKESPSEPARTHEIVPVKASTTPRKTRPAPHKPDVPDIKADEAVVSPGKEPLRSPSLSAQVDDEDKSLRLTDLFDTLDSKM